MSSIDKSNLKEIWSLYDQYIDNIISETQIANLLCEHFNVSKEEDNANVYYEDDCEMCVSSER